MSGRNPRIEAKYYDSEYTFTEDIDLYLSMTQEKKCRILELGCGSGRLLVPLANAGHRVEGIDNSKYMIELLKQKIKILSPQVQKRITIHEGDMRSFELKERFDVILLAFNLFFMAKSRSDQIEILNRVNGHLKSGGRVIISTANPAQDWFREKLTVMKYYGTYLLKETETPYDRYYTNQLSEEEQRIAFNLYYDTIRPDGAVKREKNTIILTYVHSFELQYLLSLIHI